MPLMTIKGWIPDPEVLPEYFTAREFSDRYVQRAFTGMMKSVGGDHDIPHQVPVYDQEDIGSCVLNSSTGCMNIVLSLQKNQTEELSRNFAYWHCRKVMGTKNEDSGTYLWLAVDRHQHVGVCHEKTWKYGHETLFQAPTPDCYPEASDNKATAWFAIKGDGKARCDQVEQAVRANHPVMFGTPVDMQIQTYQKGQILSIPSGSILGGHAMVVTGVRYINGRRVFRIRNSWGWWYGDAGHLLMDEEWLGWSSLTDLWVLTAMDPLMF